MSQPYVKLFGSILDSSIWDEDGPTRLCWITMLAMADEHGIVHASVGGIANRARITKQEASAALDKFLAPDIDSKDQRWAGRRVERVDGGWEILNHPKYREMRSREQVLAAERQRRKRQRERDERERQPSPKPPAAKPAASVTDNGTGVTGHDVTEEVEVERDVKKNRDAKVTSQSLEMSQAPKENNPVGKRDASRDGAWITTRMALITADDWQSSRRLTCEATALWNMWVWTFKRTTRVVFSDAREQRARRYISAYGLVRCCFAVVGAMTHPHMNPTDGGTSYHDFENIFLKKDGHDRVEKLADHAIKHRHTRRVRQYLEGLETQKGWTPGPLDTDLFRQLKGGST